MRALLAERGVELGPVDASGLPDFAEQCAAIVEAKPHVASSIMGLYPPEVVAALKRQGTAWFATVTTLAEAEAAQAAGADAVVVSGVEAGGHRGSFDPAAAERQGGTLFALLPLVADALSVPVVAAGGIADGRGLAAALTLGASAVQVGTALLRTPEAGTAPAWSDAIAHAAPEDTVLTRAFSGRLARAVRNEWTETVGENALPYPVQRQATAHLRARAVERGDGSVMQMWAGQAARLSRAGPAADVVRRMWSETDGLLA
jgi:nitronate monooxygenase